MNGRNARRSFLKHFLSLLAFSTGSIFSLKRDMSAKISNLSPSKAHAMGSSTKRIKKIGVEEAIMYSNIKFWCTKNKANKKHLYDGHYWTYNSQEAFGDLFPFWSRRQIQRILKNLIDKGYIKEANYNKKGFDRTKWYSIAKRNP